MTYHRGEGPFPPAPISLNDPNRLGLKMADMVRATGMDKHTILDAIHRGDLPAWQPGGNAYNGWRVHRNDLTAWFFRDPSRAHTPGVGSPGGPQSEAATA